MKIFVNLFFILTIFCVNSESIVIDCIYENNPYQCKVQNLILVSSKNDREVTGVRGNHLSGKTNDDVTNFYSNSRTINYFPRGITKFFKNIDTIPIKNANIKEITKEDLKEFGGIFKNLYIYNDNHIEVIESDLFTYNKNLERIYLTNNKIKHISDGAFDGLEKLHTLYLNQNPCTGNRDTTHYSNVKTLIKSIESNCKDPNYIPTKPKPSTTTQNPIIAAQNEEISKLKLNLKTCEVKNEEIENLKAKNLQLKAENLQLKVENFNQSAVIQLQTEKVSQVNAEILKLQEENKKFDQDVLKTFIDTKFSSLETKSEKFIIISTIHRK